MKTPPNRVIVTGAGRCGTTALMKFFTKSVGSDSVISKMPVFKKNSTFMPDTSRGAIANATKCYNSRTRAGIEYTLTSKSTQEEFELSPYIIKDPRLCVELKQILRTDKLRVDHLFILIRDFKKSARSRVKNKLLWSKQKHIAQCDTRYDTLKNATIFKQRVIGNLMETVAEFDIPHTILHFPTFIENKEYLFKKLIGTPVESSRAKFDEAFSVFDKNLIEH